jgi:DNA-directed RNA polymerase beta' subunit
MAVHLSDSQKKELLDIIPLSKSIPHNAALSFQKKTQRVLLKHLEDIKLHPSKFSEFKHIVQERYRKSLISPGESVGVVCAQSIGQMNTQMTLNSFHHAGISEAAMTAGVPKFQELLSATKNPKIVNSSVYFIHRPQSLDQLIKACAGKLKCLRLKDTIKGWNIVDSDIEFDLNWKMLYRYSVYPSDIVNRVKRAYEDIKVSIKPSTFTPLLSITPLIVDDTIDTVKYINDIAIPNLLPIVISGIVGIEDIFYEKSRSWEGLTILILIF